MRPLPDATGFELPPQHGPCLCGAQGTRSFRGWDLCDECGPRVERAWRRANPVMATSIRKPKR